MKAVLKVRSGPRGVEYADVDAPKVAPGDVVVKVMAAGICGSDVHIYDWDENKVRDSKIRLPVVMGHECAGIITEVGSSVKNLKLGDRVTVNPILNCGECYFCRHGQEQICDDRSTLGYRINGAFAQFILVDSKKVFKLPEELSFEVGALSELACVGLHAINRIPVEASDRVAVIGSGPLGLVMTILVRHAGCEKVFVTGLRDDQERLEIARNLGAIPVQAELGDAKELILELTDGLGADVVFESAGSPSAVKQALSIVRKGGKIGILGQASEPTDVSTAMLSFREIQLIGSRAHTRKEWQLVSHVLLEAKEDFSRIITHRLPLFRAEEGLNMMKRRIGIKVMLLPQHHQ